MDFKKLVKHLKIPHTFNDYYSIFKLLNEKNIEFKQKVIKWKPQIKD